MSRAIGHRCIDEFAHVILRITDEFIDECNTDCAEETLNNLDARNYEKVIKYLLIKTRAEYSHIIFMIVFIRSCIQDFKISKRDSMLNYVFVAAISLSIKFNFDSPLFISDIVSNTNLDLEKCIKTEELIFRNVFVDITCSFRWEHLYYNYSNVFVKYLDKILIEKNAKRIILKHARRAVGKKRKIGALIHKTVNNIITNITHNTSNNYYIHNTQNYQFVYFKKI